MIFAKLLSKVLHCVNNPGDHEVEGLSPEAKSHLDSLESKLFPHTPKETVILMRKDVFGQKLLKYFPKKCIIMFTFAV